MSYPIDDFTPPRVTKTLVENFIASHLGLHPSRLNFNRLAEAPKQWKHACVIAGVTLLEPQSGYLFTTSVTFAFCSLCGRVHYYFDSPQGGWA